MPSRFGANIEQVWKDHVHEKGKGDPVGIVATGLAKTYDAISGVGSSIVGAFNAKEFEVVQRDGITAATRSAIHNTMSAQWFTKGPARILNVIPKAITGILELPDGLIRDGIHVLGGGRAADGYVVKNA